MYKNIKQGVNLENEILFFPFFLSIINFFGFRAYWNYILILITFLLIFKKRFKAYDNSLFLLLFYMISYSLILINYGDYLSNKTFFYILAPTSFYLFGKYTGVKLKQEKEIFRFILILIFINSLIPFISNIISVQNVGFMKTRNISMIWSDLVPKAGTLCGAYVAMNLSLIALLVLNKNYFYSHKHKLVILILFAMGLFVILNISTRTGLFIGGISALLPLLVVKTKRKTFLRIILLTIITIFIIKVSGIWDWFTDSYFYTRFTVELKDVDISRRETIPRIFRWGYALQGLLDYPMGGRQSYIVEGNYVHNLWLDVAWTTGVIPFMFLMMFTIKSILTIIKITMNKEIAIVLRLLILSVFISLVLNFSVEPVMEGLFPLFCLWCFFIGFFKLINKNFSKNTSNEQ